MPETVKCVYYAWISQKDLLILLEYQFSLEHNVQRIGVYL